MTPNADDTALATPTTALAGEQPESSGSGRVPVGRLIGVDLARGLAVFGMYAAHVGPDPSQGGVTGHLMEPAHGRACALFASLWSRFFRRGPLEWLLGKPAEWVR
jgi:hypothetical protein